MINASTLSSYQQAGRLRRRLAAQQLALGGFGHCAGPAWRQSQLGGRDMDSIRRGYRPWRRPNSKMAFRGASPPGPSNAKRALRPVATSLKPPGFVHFSGPRPMAAAAILDHFSWLPHPLSEAKKTMIPPLRPLRPVQPRCHPKSFHVDRDCCGCLRHCNPCGDCDSQFPRGPSAFKGVPRANGTANHGPRPRGPTTADYYGYPPNLEPFPPPPGGTIQPASVRKAVIPPDPGAAASMLLIAG